ncbi:MAG TPA: calcium-binding protein [Nitrospira sp.]|nr:calcium-binding protein [Nitrospira sp.]
MATPGDDIIVGTLGPDTINGLGGNDTIVGLAGADTLYGDAAAGPYGRDNLIGGDGNDKLYGFGGNDWLIGGKGNDLLNGGSGIDTADYSNRSIKGIGYIGATAAVTVDLNLAGAQNTGGSGFDTLVSIENVTGTKFNDTLIGNGSANVLVGLEGNDFLNGRGGNDRLEGGTGDDFLNGGDGNDTLNGGDGIDTLDGWNGHDTLNGGAGNDTLLGYYGNDTLTGGAGKDTLWGESGNDKFVYTSVSDSPAFGGRDVIQDFAGNGAFAGDQIDVHAIDANGTLSGNQDFTYIGSNPFTFNFFSGTYIPGQLRYDSGTGILQGNTDFDGAPEFEVQLDNHASVFFTDLIL